jgi:hypothetical protein
MRVTEAYALVCYACQSSVEIAAGDIGGGMGRCRCGAPLEIDWQASRADYDAIRESEQAA